MFVVAAIVYDRLSPDKTSYEEAIRRQVREAKEKRARQLAEVEARRRISYRLFWKKRLAAASPKRSE